MRKQILIQIKVQLLEIGLNLILLIYSLVSLVKPSYFFNFQMQRTRWSKLTGWFGKQIF